MEKVDFKKEYSDLYKPRKGKIVTVSVPKMKFLMIDGKGNPNTSRDFKDAMNILFTVSYGVKFLMKQKFEKDYVVMPPEGLWWAENMDDFLSGEKDKWLWTIMMMQPEFVRAEHIKEASDNAVRKGKLTSELLSKARFELFEEGECVQTIYVGSFDEETETIKNMHDMIKNNGWELCGKHHEIYLSDARKVAPEKYRTIIRQPFKR